MSQFKLITEGVCKGMKVLTLDFGWHTGSTYFDGDLSDEECINRLMTHHNADSASGEFFFLEKQVSNGTK